MFVLSSWVLNHSHESNTYLHIVLCNRLKSLLFFKMIDFMLFCDIVFI